MRVVVCERGRLLTRDCSNIEALRRHIEKTEVEWWEFMVERSPKYTGFNSHQPIHFFIQ